MTQKKFPAPSGMIAVHEGTAVDSFDDPLSVPGFERVEPPEGHPRVLWVNPSHVVAIAEMTDGAEIWLTSPASTLNRSGRSLIVTDSLEHLAAALTTSLNRAAKISGTWAPSSILVPERSRRKAVEK